MPRLASLPTYPARLTVFLAVLVLYALAGSPTPDEWSWELLTMGALLVLAVGAPGLAACFPRGDRIDPLWQQAARALLCYILIVPTLTGLVAGNLPALLLRDLISMVFILLPLFAVNIFPMGTRARNLLCGAVVMIGIVFAARVSVPELWPLVYGQPGPAWGHVSDPLNLANAPSVLFAGLFLLGCGGRIFARARSGREAGKALMLLAGAALILITMMMIAQRAYLGAACIAACLWLLVLFFQAPHRLLRPLVILSLAMAMTWPLLTDVGMELAHKTTLVGFNNRFEEARTVLESTQDRFFWLLFGQGWGATIDSPAVGGMRVNFTHSLITTMILKTGLAGLMLCLVYIGLLAGQATRNLARAPVPALALGFPLVINIFLYASFKSLDFGLILLILALYSRPENLQENPYMVYVKRGSPQEYASH